MPVPVPVLALLVHLLTASVHANDPTDCPDISEWTLDNIVQYLRLESDAYLQPCLESILLTAIDAGRVDTVQAIIGHERVRISRRVATRTAWYAYVISWQHSPANSLHMLATLLPHVRESQQIPGYEDVMDQFSVHYSLCSQLGMLSDRRRILGAAPTIPDRPYRGFGRGLDQQQHLATYQVRPSIYRPNQRRQVSIPTQADVSRQTAILPPCNSAGPDPVAEVQQQHESMIERGSPLRDVGRQEARPAADDAAEAAATVLCTLPSSSATAIGSSRRRRPMMSDGDVQDQSQEQRQIQRIRQAMRLLAVRSDRLRSASLPPSPSLIASQTGTRNSRWRRRQGSGPWTSAQCRQLLRRQRPRSVAPASSIAIRPAASDWRFDLQDGTQQEQGRQFLGQVADMIAANDERVRGHLFVKSESSPAIDQGGLSVSLIQFASTELTSRLSCAGQLLHSQGMDKAFVPRSPTIGNDDERRDLMLLGALIGIIDNHRRTTPKRNMLLPIPLPVVAFRALLRNATTSVSDNEAGGTALGAVYRQYCGESSPTECNRIKQIDVDELFANGPGADYSNADEYLRGLVGRLLNSQAFEAVRQGYQATTTRMDRDADHGYQAMHQAIVADPSVTLDKLWPLHLSFEVDLNDRDCDGLARRHADDVVADALKGLSDEECADFVEATTGARCLPLIADGHSKIAVVIRRCDGIVFHTCFRSVDIPVGLISDGASTLREHLKSSMDGIVGQGVTYATYNTA